jgi:putative membrane protein
MSDEEPRGLLEAAEQRREHLANERTHLAYIRTAIALFAFGITLNQFSVYIAEHRQPHPALVAGWRVGFGMVVAGLVLTLWSAWRFERVTRDINRGVYQPSRVAMWVLSFGVLILGGAAAVWLLWR